MGKKVNISMFPKDGWSNFEESESVSNLIWDTLETRDIGGVWEYYNFTSDISIWSYGIYSLTIQFVKENYDKVQSIQFTNPNLGNAELNQLITILKERYGFINNLN